MGLTISVSLDALSKPQKEILAGFILAYPNGYSEEDDLPEDTGALQPPAAAITHDDPDPAAAFGSPSGHISSLGPVLVIPSPPLVAPVPTAPPSGGVTVDKKGLPWDGRIHSSSKATNADGTWRGKRGVTAGVIAQVESELRALMAIPGPLAQNAPGVAQPATMASVAITAVNPSAPSTTAPPPPPPVNEAEMRQKYVDFIGRTSAAISAGKINQEQLKRCYEAVGISDMPQLGIRPDLLPAVAALVDGIIAGQSA